MKKHFPKLLVAMMLLAIISVLVSCNIEGTQSPISTTENTVTNQEGTNPEETTVSDELYKFEMQTVFEMAKEVGYTGTLDELVALFKGEAGPAGKDGITPHIGKNGNWWVGDTDLGVVAQGTKGDQGEQGIQGEQGEKGDKGDQGDQGIQGEKGDKGDQGEQGIQGEKGDKGDQGEQGIQGEKGDKGDQGEQGIQGEQGVGIASTTMDENGNIVITYTDGSVEIIEHNWAYTYTLKVPTCIETGVDLYSCTNCTLVKMVAANAMGHSFENGVCQVCGERQPSEGLEFMLNSDGQSYSVVDIGTCTDTDVVIPKVYEGLPVTTIGYGAFKWCDNLTSVTIPDSVISIDEEAFDDCNSALCTEYQFGKYVGDSTNPYAVLIELTNKNLTTYEIHPNTKIIARGVFQDCHSLTNITIPDSVTGISDWAFENCNNLTSVTIGDSVTSIGNSAFNNCYALTSVTIPDSVTSIGNYAFSGCYVLTSVTIPDSVTSIGNYAFSHCYVLTSITIPDSVTSIGNGAFCNCDALTSITIPDSVTSIGDSAFYSCSNLRSVTIPDSVTSIGYRAFYWCDITDVYYTGNEADWVQITIDSSNYALTYATIHYNYIPEE